MTHTALPSPVATEGAESYVDLLIERVEGLQSHGSRLYGPGIFPSRRTHPRLPYSVDDETIFFTVVILYTLQALQSRLSPRSRDAVTAMTERCRSQVRRFRNRQDRPIYNYWQTSPVDRFFPNGRVLSRFRKFRLPEDIDTTAYVYLAGFHDEADARRFQERLAHHANGSQRWIRHSLRHHRNRRAYSTWMGEANMPVDFDVCAMANTLLALQSFGLPLSETDRETVRFVEAVVTRGEHITHAFRSAPWYGTPPIIIYHLARLIGRTDITELQKLRDRLTADARKFFESDRTRPMERLMLSTAAMFLGRDPMLAAIPDQMADEVTRFAFFTASLLAVPENRLAHALAPMPVFHLRYVCPAHSLALVAEHEVLRSS